MNDGTWRHDHMVSGLDHVFIEDTHLATMVRNALFRAGIRTVAELAAIPDSQLRAISGLGAKGRALLRARVPYDPTPVAPSPPPQQIVAVEAVDPLTRIAAALERIAAVLERGEVSA